MGQRELQRRVSQKLAFARWHLSWWQQQESDDAQRRSALLESAVWHVLGAYRAFLAEMASDEHMLAAPDSALPIDGVALSKAYADYVPAAVAECANLEQQASFLQDILQWGRLVEGVVANTGAPAANMIGSSGSGLPDGPELTQCIDQLEALIERLRGDMLEF